MADIKVLQERIHSAISNSDKIKSLSLLSKEFRAVDLEKAKLYAEECLALIGTENIYDEEQADAHFTLGFYNQSTGNIETAIQEFKMASNLYSHLNDKHNLSISYLRISACYRNKAEYTDAIQYGKAALELIRTIDDKRNLCSSLNNLGISYYYSSDYPNALKYHQESLAIYLDLNDEYGIASTFSNLALIYGRLGDYLNALQLNQESYRLRVSIGDKRGMSMSLNNIGMLYEKLSDFPSALSYHKESKLIKESIGDKHGIAQSLINLGNTYEKMSDYKQALDCYQESLVIWESINDKHGTASALTNIGHIHETLIDYPNAQLYYNKGLTIFKAIGDKYGVVNSQIGLAKVSIEVKQFDTAKQILEDSLLLCDEIGVKEERYLVLELLSDLYQEIGDYQKALESYKGFHLAKEEVFNQDKEQRLATLQVRFETEQAKKDAEIQKQEFQLERLKNVELANAINEVKLQKELAEKASTLKSELIGIAAHDLKNPLQSIMGFADLIQERISNTSAVLIYSKTIKQASERMYNTISSLLTSVKYDTVDMKINKRRFSLSDLLLAVLQNNAPQLESKSIKVETFFDADCTAEVDISLMSDVFDNLISNAIKFSSKGGKIEVKIFKRIEPDRPLKNSNEIPEPKFLSTSSIIISIKDYGQGLNELDKEKLFLQFQKLSSVPTDGESSSGLGLYIVKQIVKLHQGFVWAESEGKEKGSTFFVQLPAQPSIP